MNQEGREESRLESEVNIRNLVYWVMEGESLKERSSRLEMCGCDDCLLILRELETTQEVSYG